MCRISVISVTHSASDRHHGLVQCQVSESAPPFRHTHLLCHNFGLHLLFVFKLVILTAESLQGLAGMSRGRQPLLSLTLIQVCTIVYIACCANRKYTDRENFL
ncbi:hypothetical protein EV424DRAFT_918127 [Suillus variegatus]|nr:hypothetical protein EV424DRAFT_918127 [Suillus variegatus]